MGHRRLWILLGGIVLMSAAFLLLNFRAAANNTHATQMILTTELQGHYPERLQPTDQVSLVLTGDRPLLRPLQKALMQEMGKAGMGQIELEREIKTKYPNPVLIVSVDRLSLVWTPILAMSQFSVHAAYATDGDTTFIEVLDKTKLHIPSADPSVVNLYTEYEGSDRSFGLISRPGYHQYLADYLAQEIVQALKNLYNIQDMGG